MVVRGIGQISLMLTMLSSSHIATEPLDTLLIHGAFDSADLTLTQPRSKDPTTKGFHLDPLADRFS